MNDKKIIIFDFDGTIANTEELVIEKIKIISDKFNLNLTKKEIGNLIQNKLIEELMKKFKINKFKLFLLIFKIKKELKEVILEAKPFKDIEFCLKELKIKEYSLGILSSNSKKNIIKFLRKYKLENYFNFIETTNFLFGKHKKIEKIIKQYNLNKKKLIYIGDEVRDLKACERINVKSIIVHYGFNSKQLILKSNPKFIAKNPREILNIIKNKI